jgi:hypothetical protein
MATRYRYETTLSFNPDRADFTEVDVGVSFEVSFGTPETGCFGPVELYDPGSGDEVHSIRLETVGGRKAPWNLHFHSDKHFAALVVEMLEASEHHLSAMIEAAHEEEVALEDAVAEARWEARREMAW